MKNIQILFVLFLSVILLGGCTASNMIQVNADAEVGSYENIVLVAPSKDPRNMVEEVCSRFEALGYKVYVVSDDKPVEGIHGTAFSVISGGYFLTAAHVVSDEEIVQLSQSEENARAKVVAKSDDLDIALLKLEDGESLGTLNVLPLNLSEAAQLGDDVSTVGFPLSSILGKNVRFSKGTISALSGIEDDNRHLQFSAPIQSGNSGGPLLDANGQVVGVITHSLNASTTLRAAGSLPQNVNFAVRSELVSEFLESNFPDGIPETVETLGGGIANAANSVVRVRSGGYPAELIGKSNVAVKMKYQSMWDIVHTFRYFLLTFYDLSAEDTLFVVGQRAYTMGSSEGAILDDAFKKIEDIMGLQDST